MDGSMDGWMDEWIGGYVKEQTDGWMERRDRLGRRMVEEDGLIDTQRSSCIGLSPSESLSNKERGKGKVMNGGPEGKREAGAEEGESLSADKSRESQCGGCTSRA